MAKNLFQHEMSIEDFILIANGYVSALVNKMLNRAFKMADLNITTEQWTILCSLWEEDGQTQQSLSDNTFKEKASVTRLLDTLERNMYITRQPNPNDRRTNLIYLTERGTQLEQRATDIVEKFIHRAIEDIDSRNLTFLKETILKMYHNLS